MQNPSTVTQESVPIFDFVTGFSKFAFSHRSPCSNSDGFVPSTSSSLHFNGFRSLRAHITRKTLISASLNTRNAAGANLRRFIGDFNSFIRFRSDRVVPYSFASDGIGSSSEENGFREDGSGEALGYEGFPLNVVESDRPKKVLILMSDTGGGHRASAEAIKVAFNLEFGDAYQVFSSNAVESTKDGIYYRFMDRSHALAVQPVAEELQFPGET